MKPFEDVWQRIVALQGQEFQTITGKPFHYEVRGSVFRCSRTDWNIPKSGFEKAYLCLKPSDGPGTIRDTVHGYAYVWAVLRDPRVAEA